MLRQAVALHELLPVPLATHRLQHTKSDPFKCVAAGVPAIIHRLASFYFTIKLILLRIIYKNLLFQLKKIQFPSYRQI